ncbi:hypothetical protein OH76DRAFT_4923 [Lentinus brumalis]|uniref:Uncharacterized protein n=1 Tax=Lentinus brumalis TaxID=2498619 RepID=A0A371DWT1_9APHY|nr:hypothetical protein OH76DRAFT_4923 [Polyporus brumalis]
MLLDDLVEDALLVTVAQLLLLKHKGDLANLASTSRKIRDLCSPILFSRCVTTCSGRRGIPPESIRPFVHHLTYLGRLMVDYEDTFGPELPYLPELRAVTFNGCNFCDIPWAAFKRCLALPNVTSITFEPTTSFIGIFPAPEHDIMTLQPTLTAFTYNPDIWRALTKDPSRSAESPLENISSRLADPYTTEYLSLSPLILQICDSVQSLTLPIEIAPWDRMVRLRWPELRRLCLSGQFPSQTVSSLLCAFINTLPRLTTLSVQLARKRGQGRLSLLGRQHSRSFELRSLTLAYPDPNDTVFDIDSTFLTQLSLRDYPRYYYHLAFSDVARRWSAPILTSSECLSVLRRMDLPALHTLELVYETDGDDDDLLRHISISFPRLMHLELHRYRRDRAQVVPHTHIAGILASAVSLRTVNLNLDFHDEVRLYSEDMPGRARCKDVRDARGWELANIFEACRQLEYVALLTHGLSCSLWLQFHPRRCAEPRYTAGSIDSPPLPRLPQMLPLAV